MHPDQAAPFGGCEVVESALVRRPRPQHIEVAGAVEGREQEQPTGCGRERADPGREELLQLVAERQDGRERVRRPPLPRGQ